MGSPLAVWPMYYFSVILFCMGLHIEKKVTYTWPVNYADNLFLPFARLAAKTFLPPGVLILARNPWTLLLCLFFGWYVIFIYKTPPFFIYLIRFYRIIKYLSMRPNTKYQKITYWLYNIRISKSRRNLWNLSRIGNKRGTVQTST